MKKQFFTLMLVLATTASAQRTPTMGWSSWNTFALNINEQLIRQQADAMYVCPTSANAFFSLKLIYEVL